MAVKDKEIRLDTETQLMKYKTELNRKIDDIKIDINTINETVKRTKHSIEMANLESNRIDREVQNTDFYLNKVQPIANFT